LYLPFAGNGILATGVTEGAEERILGPFGFNRVPENRIA